MKKALIVLMVLFLLAGCQSTTTEVKIKKHSGLWLTYNEINQMLDSGFEESMNTVIKNCQSLEINNLYFHVRAFGDAVYNSSIFPQNPKVKEYNFDILKYVINLCHKNGILVHAWINPYRISNTTENIDEIDPQSPAYKWLMDDNPQNDKNVCIMGGIYLNPAESEVQQIIINGVREIVSSYDIDGIHFDDYFYPTQSVEFDSLSYNEYIAYNLQPLSIEDWRRINVNSLLSGTYNAIKHLNEKVVFSVSPAASVENNYNNLYADVRAWVDNGYVDAIIPQLYFGFNYPDENYKFENLLKTWQDVVALNPDVKLYIGLAAYKANPSLEADKVEWQQNFDIIKRQVEFADNNPKVNGYVYFSYSSLFSSEKPFKMQLKNLKDYIKTRK